MYKRKRLIQQVIENKRILKAKVNCKNRKYLYKI